MSEAVSAGDGLALSIAILALHSWDPPSCVPQLTEAVTEHV